MELKQAKEIVNQAIDIAIKHGCFDLVQSQAIIHALEKISGLDDIEFSEVVEKI